MHFYSKDIVTFSKCHLTRERVLTCKKPTWNSNKHAILVIKRKSLRLIQTLMLWFRNPNYEATISKRYKPIFRRLLIPEYYFAS